MQCQRILMIFLSIHILKNKVSIQFLLKYFEFEILHGKRTGIRCYIIQK